MAGSISGPLRGLRVFLCEGDEQARALFTAALRQYGAEVLPVATPREEAELFADGEPDVVVADFSLDHGGALAERAVEAGVPAVALTVDRLPAGVAEILHAGAHVILVRPVTAGELCAAVAEVLD